MARAQHGKPPVSWAFGVLLLGACEVAPPPEPRDAGRRIRLDGGPAPDAYATRPVDPVLPPVDLEITLAFGEETRIAIEVGAAVADLDLVLSVDTTGSFSGEIDALQSSFVSAIIPALERRAERLAIAVARFEDFPFGGFGEGSDVPFELLTPITSDLSRVSSAISRLDMPLGSGGDLPESGYEALFQIATGQGVEFGGRTLVTPWSASRMASGGGDEPGVGFRRGSLRAVVHVTDAPSHDGRAYGDFAADRAATVVALRTARIRVIGIASGEVARPQLEDLAIVTGAVLPPERGACRTGLRGATRAPVDGVCPLVFDLADDGTGLSEVLVQAIADLLRSLSYREMWGAARDDRFGLVSRVEAVSATIEPPGVAPERTDERPVDGIADTFRDVERGVTVRFEAVLVNDVLPPEDYDQRVTLTLDVLGDGIVVASRTVRVTVPRGRLPRPDASIDAWSADAATPLTLDAWSTPDAWVDDDAGMEADAAVGEDASEPIDAHGGDDAAAEPGDAG
ncbi:MAG: hypothetical protein OHK0013_46030 [Sandaracinaceae bacterium]